MKIFRQDFQDFQLKELKNVFQIHFRQWSPGRLDLCLVSIFTAVVGGITIPKYPNASFISSSHPRVTVMDGNPKMANHTPILIYE